MLHMESYTELDCSFTTFFNHENNNHNNKIQRRFTNQQTKSLETIFQTDSKLEPRKKLQVAKDLGLQPRQVAIWFQNKRARWRSKQLERDYTILRASFDSLSSRYDILTTENQSLKHQLSKLRKVVEDKAKRLHSSSGEIGSMEEKVKPEGVEDEKNVRNVDDNNWRDDLEGDQVLDDDKWWDLWS
ncbi:hypothetical protein SSX86_027190 [Deinandra increscens subsp. villosa]|uniref:Homeobox-leucine zipper protein n=1 Tax=Deinandra increscens subsp. villosa TaxID=3103831 RepID=A0AAP0CL20_9ASTR